MLSILRADRTSPAGFTLFALSRLGSQYDPKEPPVLPQKVPFFGHILGLLQHGLKYYTVIR